LQQLFSIEKSQKAFFYKKDIFNYIYIVLILQIGAKYTSGQSIIILFGCDKNSKIFSTIEQKSAAAINQLNLLGYLLLILKLQMQKIIVIGIGNPLCGDDGAGAYLCQLLEDHQTAYLSLIATTQLDASILEELKEIDIAILADASINHDIISIEKINPLETQPSSSSHHIHPALFAQLAEKLYSLKTVFYTCAIPAKNFEIGHPLSENCKQAVEETVTKLLNWITSMNQSR